MSVEFVVSADVYRETVNGPCLGAKESFVVRIRDFCDHCRHGAAFDCSFVQDEVECSDDYLFSYYGTGAWASWRRVAKEWDETYSYLDDARAMSNVRGKYPALADTSYKTALKRRKSGKAYWETILGFNASLNNRLVIIPRVNLVSNIGVTDGATHGTSLWLMNRRVRKLFFMDAKDIDFPLMHPKYILPDYKYLDEMSKINCFGRPFLAFVRKVEYLIKRIVYTLFVKK